MCYLSLMRLRSYSLENPRTTYTPHQIQSKAGLLHDVQKLIGFYLPLLVGNIINGRYDAKNKSAKLKIKVSSARHIYGPGH